MEVEIANYHSKWAQHNYNSLEYSYEYYTLQDILKFEFSGAFIQILKAG